MNRSKKISIFKIIIISLLVIFSSCNSLKNESANKHYKILGIDSIANVYIIHAKYEKQYFKIVSHKIEPKRQDCEIIRIGKSYKLDLKSLFLNKEKLPLIVNGVDFYGQTIDIEKDSIFDVHTANNLSGLCLIIKR